MVIWVHGLPGEASSVIKIILSVMPPGSQVDKVEHPSPSMGSDYTGVSWSTLNVLARLNPSRLWGVVEFDFRFSLQLYFFNDEAWLFRKTIARRALNTVSFEGLCIYDWLIWPKLLQKITNEGYDTFTLFYLGDRSSGFARRSPHHRDGTPLNLCRHHSRHRFKFKTSGEKGHAGTHRKIHAGKNHPR